VACATQSNSRPTANQCIRLDTGRTDGSDGWLELAQFTEFTGDEGLLCVESARSSLSSHPCTRGTPRHLHDALSKQKHLSKRKPLHPNRVKRTRHSFTWAELSDDQSPRQSQSQDRVLCRIREADEDQVKSVANGARAKMRAVRRRREQRQRALRRAVAGSDSSSQSQVSSAGGAKDKAAQRSAVTFDDMFSPSSALLREYSGEEFAMDETCSAKVKKVSSKKQRKAAKAELRKMMKRNVSSGASTTISDSAEDVIRFVSNTNDC
jgi:hypothetical protein